MEQAIRLGFPASNSEAEYEAILFGLNLALALSTSKLEICSDSQLVVGHIQGEYEAKDELITTKKCYFLDLIIMVLSTFE